MSRECFGAGGRSGLIRISTNIIRHVDQLVMEEDPKISEERIRLIKLGKCTALKSIDLDWYVCEKSADDFFKYNPIFGKSKIRVIALSLDHIIIGQLANKDGSLISVKPKKVFPSCDLFQVLMGLSRKDRLLEITFYYYNKAKDYKQPPLKCKVVFGWDESRKFIPVMQKHFEKYAVNLVKVEDMNLDY